MAKDSFRFSLPNWGKIMDEGETVKSIFKIAELGFDGIEFFAGSPYNMLSFDLDKIGRVSKTLKDYGIEPVSIMPDYDAGPGDWWRTGKDFYSPTATPEKFVERVEKSIQIGSKLGCTKCNIHTMNKPKEILPRDKAWQNLVYSFSKCAEVAEKYNVILCNEVEPGMMFSNEQDILNLLDEIRSENYGVLVDTCLVYIISGGKSVDFIRKLKGNIKHVHISDQNESINEMIKIKDEKINCPMDLLKGNVRVPVGSGVLNLPEIMNSLIEVGYKGWLTIENAGININPDKSVVEGKKHISRLLEELLR